MLEESKFLVPRLPFAGIAKTIFSTLLVFASFLLGPEVYAVTVYRALLTFGSEEPGMREDAEHLREVLSRGTNWDVARITVSQAETSPARLKTQVNNACGTNDDDDICLFYYAGHGFKKRDDDNDDNDTEDRPVPRTECRAGGLPCDESINPQSNSILDDDLGDELAPVFQDIRGTLILVFDSCFSGGLGGRDEGSKDLIRVTGDKRILFLAACTKNQESAALRAWPGAPGNRHFHGIFTGGLIEGLADSRDTPGPANADSSATKGEVTVTEWFTYASQIVRTLRTTVGTNQEPKEPQRGGGAALNTVVLQYTNGTTNLSNHGTAVALREPAGEDIAFRCLCPECEIDPFPNTLAQVTIDTSFGPETVILTGGALIIADLSTIATTTSGLEQIETELLGLRLTGPSNLLGPITLRLRDPERPPFQRSIGQIQEATNSTPGVLDLPPFTAGGTAESFFDVFVEIEAPNAPSGFTRLHNETPVRISTTITEKPSGINDTYTSVNLPVSLFDDSGAIRGRIIAGDIKFRPNCDLDGNGVIDRDDINTILAGRTLTSVPIGDPRDIDGDGRITARDAKICIPKCTNPQCAP